MTLNEYFQKRPDAYITIWFWHTTENQVYRAELYSGDFDQWDEPVCSAAGEGETPEAAMVAMVKELEKHEKTRQEGRQPKGN